MNNSVFIGDKEYFPGINKILYEGLQSDNPLAFKVYDPSRLVNGRTMQDHLRFSICYWHSFCADGSDPFGPGTRSLPWKTPSDEMAAAEQKMDAAFEFFTKIGSPYYCFHDRDMAPEGNSVSDSEVKLQRMVESARARQNTTGVKLLWGTANVFSHPRYMNGASTNPDFSVLAHAGAQVKSALDATVALGGENYVFWGGREGYSSLLNTDTSRELDHMAQFLTMARDYGRSIGFEGKFLIEPKPMEPMYHQYDVDAQTVIGFLRHHQLDKDFALNIEANHATLAGHSFMHDLQMSADANLLGSIDANRGNPQNGWDTDQFPTDLYDTTQAMLVVLQQGGFKTGGLNFDAKVRRESTDLEDLFIAHIGGMDAFAKGLLTADSILNEGNFSARSQKRYESFDNSHGKSFEEGKLTLNDLRNFANDLGETKQSSGKQELMENLINTHLLKSN